MRYAIPIVLLLIYLLACGSGEAPAPAHPETNAAVTTIILVRHAEKAQGEDPDLLPSGSERADHLRDLLADSSLTAVYSTNTRRTQQTAAPTATDHQLEVKTYDAERLAAFARHLIKAHRGETVLVVGHSNTTPRLANLLSRSSKLQAFDEADYGNLLTVVLPLGQKKGTVSKARY